HRLSAQPLVSEQACRRLRMRARGGHQHEAPNAGAGSGASQVPGAYAVDRLRRVGRCTLGTRGAADDDLDAIEGSYETVRIEQVRSNGLCAQGDEFLRVRVRAVRPGGRLVTHHDPDPLARTEQLLGDLPTQRSRRSHY